MTTAVGAKSVGEGLAHWPSKVAMRRQSFNLPIKISLRLICSAWRSENGKEIAFHACDRNSRTSAELCRGSRCAPIQTSSAGKPRTSVQKLEI
jgi:hypothetical protein